MRSAVCFTALILLPAPALAQTPVEPLLRQYCIGCHNDADREGGLSMQTLDSLKRGSENGSVIDPGRPAESLLSKVLGRPSDIQMPPADEPQPTAEELEVLRKWVLAGAKIRPIATGNPDVPEVKPFASVAPSLLASVAVSDGNVVVGGGRHVALLNAQTGKVEWKTELKHERVTALSVFGKSEVIAAVGIPGVSGGAIVISVADGKVVTRLGGHTDAAYAAAVAQGGSRVATAGYDRQILLHDPKTGKVTDRLEGHNGSIFGLAFAESGKVLCSASADGTVKVWNTSTGERLDTLSQPTSEQYSVLVSADRIFAAGADNRIRIWDLVSRDKPQINPIRISRFAHEKAITKIALSADGMRLASTAEDGTLQVWSTQPFAHEQTLPTQQLPVTSLTFLSSDQLFVTYLKGTSAVLSVKADSKTENPTVVDVGIHHAKGQDTTQLVTVTEQDGHDDPGSAQAVQLPAKISGTIQSPADVDHFSFEATAGQRLLLEVNAARMKSDLDSKIRILTPDGKPVLRTRLQAVRDSWFTFRGKDSNTSNDFRVFNWEEMELNEFLYADGEVVKLWHYPRGPDSGFIVYPGFGTRWTYFDTTPTAHALQAPCFIVVPRGPDEKLIPNGLPVFPVYFENDDDGRRELGRDSRLYFTAPTAGRYVVSISDARGMGGEKFNYELQVRTPKPDFSINVNTRKLTVSPGTGREILFDVKRREGFNGPVTIDMQNLPPGFSFSGPVEIGEEQVRCMGIIYASADAKAPTPEDVAKITIKAFTEEIGERDLGKWEELKLGGAPKLRAIVESYEESDGPLVLEVRSGETIRAKVRLERNSHNGVVSFGNSDSGRNLPHGVFVDNIGLNGLLLLAGQSEREFFITASPVARPSSGTFYLKSNVDSATSQPVVLKILPRDESGQVSSR